MLYNIRKIRQENCMTQDELAKKANISRATIIKLESGEEMEVKISTLASPAWARPLWSKAWPRRSKPATCRKP